MPWCTIAAILAYSTCLILAHIHTEEIIMFPVLTYNIFTQHVTGWSDMY